MSTPFHVSQAVLDVTSTTGDSDVQLILKSDKVDYMLCILQKSGTVQVPLDLIFSEGDDISFRSVGKFCKQHGTDDDETMNSLNISNFLIGGTVHLTGYLVDDQEYPGMDEGESSDADEEVPMLVPAPKQKGKNRVVQEQEPESSSENSGESEIEEGSDDGEEEVEDSGEESEESIDEPPPKMTKISNGDGKIVNGERKKEEKPKELKQKKQQQQQQPTEKRVKVLQQNVTIEDLRVGQGTVAKPGKKVQVI